MAPQRARTCFLGFVFLAVATLPALWAAAEQRPNDQESAETSTTLGSSAAKGAPASESGASYFSEAAKLIHSDLDDNDASALYAALGRDTVELMAAEADPRESIENQPVLAQLESGLWSVLKGLAPIPSVKPDIATIHLGAGDRGSEDLILFSLGNVPGLLIVAIHRVGEKYTVLPSTTLLAARFVRDPSGQLRVPRFVGERVRALDVTGDGIKEAITEFENDGSAGAVNVDVLRWVDGKEFFKPIFSMTLSGWIGPPCYYRFVPAGSAQDIEVTLPIVGIFDNRDQHLADTSLWRYDTAADRFVKRSESIESPETARQQVNAAEVLLRQGKLPDAVRAYQRAWSDTSLTEHEELFPGADFRGFARFREGELLAILGRENEARAALQDAELRGGQLGAFARAFSTNYSGPDGAVHAWAALPNAGNRWEYVSIDGVPDNSKPTIPPGESADVLYLGQPVASYLTAHPDAAATPDAVFATLNGWGLETTAAVGIDLDGGDTNEFLFETAKDGARRLWVIYRKNGRWLVDDSYHGQVGFRGIVPLPKGNAIKLSYAPNARPGSEGALTWRDGKVMLVRLPSLELSLPEHMQSKMLPWPNCLASEPY